MTFKMSGNLLRNHPEISVHSVYLLKDQKQMDVVSPPYLELTSVFINHPLNLFTAHIYKSPLEALISSV